MRNPCLPHHDTRILPAHMGGSRVLPGTPLGGTQVKYYRGGTYPGHIAIVFFPSLWVRPALFCSESAPSISASLSFLP